MNSNSLNKKIFFLRLSFWIGAIADGIVAINWFLICFGINIPSLVTSFAGTGEDYQFAMYIAALFMSTWTVLLIWGNQKPMERRGLLFIAALFLLLSIILELLFFGNILNGSGFILGIVFRLLLITKFSFSYFYSRS